jgi:hypothetical protein
MTQRIDSSGSDSARRDGPNLQKKRSRLMLFGWGNCRTRRLGCRSTCRRDLLRRRCANRLGHRLLRLRRWFSCGGDRSRLRSILLLVRLRCWRLWIGGDGLQRRLCGIHGGARLLLSRGLALPCLRIGLRIGPRSRRIALLLGLRWCLTILLCGSAHDFRSQAQCGRHNQAQNFCDSLLNFHNTSGEHSFHGIMPLCKRQREFCTHSHPITRKTQNGRVLGTPVAAQAAFASPRIE